ncbi:hypothetical protein [Streptomyces subrutilus]|uniref:Uncharacterized protein n=1 Tax=Streptomyces subrutilus TaxID=36818 RepID=A0A5P2URE5_9ACTN|nr:hypothetical protein [Streptomyces subrutilus]QEU79297.1 hypothetical protein CP968_14085 [Streptomyces subrutilus]WSJ31510.1 hypothetical protein OG479_20745 [Streptomyces subrutilus]GGZ53429.1 hypothetical protein GCM10010371_11210 [Streptomyces subrutilus]
MDRDTGARGREHAVDWLEIASDLPHLFARLSELVHGAGYAPEDIVLIPRSELDRRETAAFTAGWAEAVAEDLPRLRREYEKRIAEAYAAGSAGRRGGPRGPGHGRDADVIRLPFAALIEPPAMVREVEDRVRRAQAALGRLSDTGHAQAAEDDGADGADGADGPDGGRAAGRARRHDDSDGPDSPDGGGEGVTDGGAPVGRSVGAVDCVDSVDSADSVDSGGVADSGAGGADGEDAGAARASGAGPLAVQQVREKRTPPASRKVVRRNGRPIVPPLDAVPVQARPPGQSADAQGPGEPRRRSLTSRARALADDMETKGGGTRPVAPEGSR